MKWVRHILKRRVTLGLILVLGLVWLFCLPAHLFTDPTCTVVEDNEGNLLGAYIADDGQWRFAPVDTVPYKFEQAILQFEDAWFYQHPGINPVSFGRAMWQNISAGKVVSGGSTITMQVIRLSRKGKPRTIWEKVVEVFQATRLELSSSKEEILAYYSNNAPFGGNVVGLDAASWRYFGRPPNRLSWAEAATLAVLPNAPALVHPGRNRDALRNKRDRLLLKLFEEGIIDETDYELALIEPLPDEPLPIPQIAPHLLNYMILNHKGETTTTTVDASRQKQVNNIVKQHLISLKANEVNNAAVLVMDVETGNVVAYVGNDPEAFHNGHGAQVDVITAPRSTGSVMKPFLYAAMLQDGLILPNTLIPDVPTYYGGYSPKNYDEQFNGAVPAYKALARSLNVPAVRMLESYGVDKFRHFLMDMGISSIQRSASHYGLSLILGGAEASLWDLCGAYASMGRSLAHYKQHSSRYYQQDWHAPNLYADSLLDVSFNVDEGQPYTHVGAGAVYLTFNAMRQVNRPETEWGWWSFSSSQTVAWKTGTSFGNRDAWAIGVTPDYVVGVWVGNADGEGRPEITGVGAAAPILFDVMALLPQTEWFGVPYDDLSQAPVCHKSGYRMGQYCEVADTIWVPVAGLRTGPCPYHHLVHTDSEGEYQVTDACMDVATINHEKWFTLPANMEWYYKGSDPTYKVLPQWMPGCEPVKQDLVMDILTPRPNTKVYVPRNLDGVKSELVFELAHRKPSAVVHWHLDGEYLGETSHFHQMGVRPSAGEHVLTVVDEEGHTTSRSFEVIDKI